MTLDEVLAQSLDGGGEAALMAATELGRQMVRAEVLPEEAVASWAQALQAQAERQPQRLDPALVQAGCAPLVELMMGYSMAFREQIEQRRDDEQRHLRAIAEQSADGVLVCDADGQVHYCNKAMAALVAPLRLVPPCALPEAWQAEAEAEIDSTPGAAAADPSLTQRVRRTARDGTPWHGDFNAADGRCFDASLFPIRDRLQRLAGCALFLRDISRTRQLERQARQSERLEAVGTLAAGVAHDFNNLVGALLGFADIGLACADDADATRRAFEQVQIIGLRARSLVQQITAFAQPAPAAPRRVSLGAVVQESLGFFAAYRPPGISVQADLPTTDLWVTADATGLQQVLLNLFNNACHAMDWQQGAIALRLMPLQDAVALDALPGYVPGTAVWRLSVSDTGCGMPPEVLARIFDPFFTTRDLGQGSGLGLSTAYGVIRGFGGAISAQSTPGTGTVFHIDLTQASPA